MSAQYRLGIDAGGTFTDFVIADPIDADDLPVDPFAAAADDTGHPENTDDVADVAEPTLIREER